MTQKLFRAEAVEHRQHSGYGSVLPQRRHILGAAIVAALALFIALSLWLSSWPVSDRESLLAWVARHVTTVVDTVR
jgi:hypothetical protein